MGTAASSALRVDTAAAGPAYGSLEALGGGARKLKKKPVLVLDPEELAQAHAMFHEASAELLGDDVERAPRPAAILGLAPMDDDEEPDDLDQTGEVEAEGEADLPSPEAVLALTRRRTPAPPVDDYIAEEPEANMDPAGPAMDDLSIAPHIEDGLDMATRIFPSLSLHPDLVDEDERPEAELPESSELPAFQTVEPEPEPEPEPQTYQGQPETEPRTSGSPKAELSDPKAVTPQPTQRAEPKEDFTFTPATPSPRAAPAQPSEPAPIMPAPSTPAPVPVPVASTESPRPARFDELNPSKDYDVPEEVYDLDRWLTEPQDDDLPSDAAVAPEPTPEAQEAPTPEPEPAPVPDTKALSEPDLALSSQQEIAPLSDEQPQHTATEVHAHVTMTEDDRIDGYAFMRDPRSRRSAVVSAPQGRQSALRAKLIREAAEEAAKAERAKASRSVVMALWKWMQSLFKPKG